MGSEVRQAQLIVLANGTVLPGVLSAEVRCNAYLSANRFALCVAYSVAGADFWSDLPLQIEVQIGVNGAWQSLIVGNVDSLDVDPVGQTATLHGRDLTALLISAQTAETFENQTASQIAVALAERRGLTPMVFPTSDMVGRYYQTGRTRTAFSQHGSMTSEWDVMIWVAEREGFDVWVDGLELYFQPSTTGAPTALIVPTECTSMRLHRALDLAGGSTVVVQSWDSRQGTAVTGFASSLVASSGGPTFTAVRPNLSSTDATLFAQRTLTQLSTHAAEVECEMPGELGLLARDIVCVSQTGTDFDGNYQIMEIDRRICFERGFTQTVVARSLPWITS